MKISFNYLFSNVTSCRCGGTITDAAVLMWGPVSITDAIAFSLIMKTSFIQMKFKSKVVAVNRLAPLRMQMGWHKALPTTQTAPVTNNCPIFYGEKLAVMPCHFIHTLHWGLLLVIWMLTAIAMNYINSNKYVGTRVYVCIEDILIIVSYAKTL